jgi:hypothetical protein
MAQEGLTAKNLTVDDRPDMASPEAYHEKNAKLHLKVST